MCTFQDEREGRIPGEASLSNRSLPERLTPSDREASGEVPVRIWGNAAGRTVRQSPLAEALGGDFV